MVGTSMRSWFALLLVVCCFCHNGSCQVLTPADADMWVLSTNTLTTMTNVTCQAYTYAAYNMTNWCQDLTVQVSSSSMLDVIISTDPIRRPTTQDRVWAWTVSPSGSPSTLTISMYDPEFVAATYFIGVYPRSQCSGSTSVTLQVQTVTPAPQDNVLVPGVPSGGILRIPDEYRYYQFCVPSCSSVHVEDHVPRSDAYPIIHISQTIRHPTVHDYTWNAGTYTPAAISGIGAKPGHYFVGYYAWCTPAQYCRDNTTCLPCSAYTDSQGVAFNLTLNIVPLNTTQCLQQATNENPSDTRPILDLGTITSGTTKTLSNEYLNCTAQPTNTSDPAYATWRSASFYKFHIDNPCSDVRISINVKQGEADLYVGQPPNTHPNHGQLTWGSYNWGSDSLFLNHSDPNYNPPLDLYVEALSYCGKETSTTGPIVQFDLVIEVIPVPTEIDILLTSTVNANQYDRNHFCVPANTDVNVIFSNNDTSSTCPTSYSFPNVVISRFDREPLINSRAWHLGASLHHDNGNAHSLALLSSNIETMPGVYYVAAYGTCSQTCMMGDMTCTPCSHYPTSYGVMAASNLNQAQQSWPCGNGTAPNTPTTTAPTTASPTQPSNTNGTNTTTTAPPTSPIIPSASFRVGGSIIMVIVSIMTYMIVV